MEERIRTGSCGTNGSGSSNIDCSQYCDGYVPGTGKLNEIQCDLVAGAPIHQLTKFCEEQGIDKNIFPITLIQAVFDGRNGMRLDRVLAMCNNIYLQWKGTFEDTVNFVQGIYRRKGLIVNYRDESGAVSTIRYNSTDISDDAWKNPNNWIGWSFDTCKDDLKELLDYIFNHLDSYPDIINQITKLLLDSDALRNILNELLLDNIDQIIATALAKYVEEYSSQADWGWAGRPYTLFEVIANFASESDLKLTYPTSIYHDSSNEEAVGAPALHSIIVDNEDMTGLHLKFTAGTWNDIMNNSNVYSTQHKDEAGFLEIKFDDAPTGLKIIVDNSTPKVFTNGYKVPCDGKNHVIILLKPSTVTYNYYDSSLGRVVTNTIEVPYGEKITTPSVGETYDGHTLVGWATNNSIINDQINGYNVVNRTSGVSPDYYDFNTPITSDLTINAWYNINATFNWTDNNGSNTVVKNVPYNTNVDDVPVAGELTGYTFEGWSLNNNVIPVNTPVGPITEPTTINGVYQEIITEYDYVVSNETGYPIQVNVGGEQIELANGETKTVTLEGTNNYRAAVRVITNVPTDSTKIVVWTINGSNGSSKTVNAGNVVIGADTTYIYKVYNNTGESSISVTVGTETKNITTNANFTNKSASSNITVNGTAPENHAWVIDGTETSTKNDVPAGTIYITLADHTPEPEPVEPTINEMIHVGFYDETSTPNNTFHDIRYGYSGKADVHNIRLEYMVWVDNSTQSTGIQKVRANASAKLDTLQLSLYVVDEASTYDINNLGSAIASVPLTFVSGTYDGYGLLTATESGNTDVNTQSVLVSNVGTVDSLHWNTLFSFIMPANVLSALTEGKAIVGVVDNQVTVAGNVEYNGNIFSYDLPE